MYTTSQKVYEIVSNMKSNFPGRGITTKMVGDKVMIVLHSYENDYRNNKNVENHLKEVFNQTITKIKEQFELETGRELEMNMLDEKMDNQPLGWNYSTTMGGAFMGNASQVVRSQMIRVVRFYDVSVEEDE
jgi:DNA-directed RNA polymerase specialized sigma54-like protein